MTRALSTLHYTRLLGILLVAVGLGTAEAQTKITPDPNKYSLQQDVELGQEAAAEARKQLPMLNDNRVDNYVERVGENLVDAIPAEFRHAGFRYTFDVVNQKEINAFALPGGPMFLNRGMIEASRSEAEMAGVMAHEISHVILRHGTAQATKGQKFQIGAVAGQVLGAIVGGAAGSVIAQGTQFGLGAYFLKYGREYRASSRSSRGPAHGACRVRPASHGDHVSDDSGRRRPQRARVAEQPPGSGQPLSRDHP